MKFLKTALLSAFVLTTNLQADEACDKKSLVIKNATVLNSQANEFVAGKIIIIDQISGTISRVDDTGKTPQGACQTVIDATGKYLVPGMTEMHGHLPYTNWSQNDTEEALFLYVAAGITTVRGMLGDPVQFTLRADIKNHKLIGPHLYLAAPSLNGRTVTSSDQGRELVRKYKTEGWDLLKIHPGLSADEYDAVADEAAKVDIKLGGHVPDGAGLMRILNAKQHTIDHMDGYWQLYTKDPVAFDEEAVIAATLKSGTTIVPTQVLFNLLRSGPGIAGDDLPTMLGRFENAYMPKATIAGWKKRVEQGQLILENYKDAAPWRDEMLKKLVDAGVPIALGSDAPQIFSVPGFSIWREIAKMKEIGMTNEQILMSAGPVPGKYMTYTGDKFGQIKVGHRADLLLLDANPLDDIMNITKQAGVIIAGRYLSQKDILDRLEDIKNRHK